VSDLYRSERLGLVSVPERDDPEEQIERLNAIAARQVARTNCVQCGQAIDGTFRAMQEHMAECGR
jgi:hypothetical protein